MADNDLPAGNEPEPDPLTQQDEPGSSDDDKTTDSDSTPDTVSRAELDKVIGERQAAKERARASDAKLAEMQATVDGMPDPDTLKAFQEWQADAKAQARDAAIKAKDVEAIEKGVREPLEAKSKALETKLTQRDGQLSSLLRNDALRTAAIECGAHSPDQVVMLLRDRVTMKDDNGQFVPEFQDGQGQPLYDGSAQRVTDAKTFVGMFLALPENANLVKTNATPGSGIKPPGGGASPSGDVAVPQTIAEWNTLSDEQKTAVRPKMTEADRKRLVGATSPEERTFL